MKFRQKGAIATTKIEVDERRDPWRTEKERKENDNSWRATLKETQEEEKKKPKETKTEKMKVNGSMGEETPKRNLGKLRPIFSRTAPRTEASAQKDPDPTEGGENRSYRSTA